MTPSHTRWPKSPPATPAAGPGRLADLFIDPLVGHQPIGIDGAGRRAAHGTAGLSEVAAVVEATLIEIRAEFRKTGPQLVGIDAPGADFTEAGRIDDVAEARDRDELGGGGRVFPGPPLLANRANTQLEARLEGVEQARLPGARRAGKDRVPAAQQVTQRRESFVRLH